MAEYLLGKMTLGSAPSIDGVMDARLMDLVPNPESIKKLAQHSANYFLLPNQSNGNVVNKLVVLIPDGTFDIKTLIKIIGLIALPVNLSVLLVGVYNQSHRSQENVYWTLAEIEPLLLANNLRATSRLIPEQELFKNWRQILQDNFMCLCFQKHRGLQNGYLVTSFASFIYRTANQPVYVMADLNDHIPHPLQKITKELVGWIMAIGLIAINFFLLRNALQMLTGIYAVIVSFFYVVIVLSLLLLINKWMN